jgi:hypothetical protein
LNGNLVIQNHLHKEHPRPQRYGILQFCALCMDEFFRALMAFLWQHLLSAPDLGP